MIVPKKICILLIIQIFIALLTIDILDSFTVLIISNRCVLNLIIAQIRYKYSATTTPTLFLILEDVSKTNINLKIWKVSYIKPVSSEKRGRGIYILIKGQLASCI